MRSPIYQKADFSHFSDITAIDQNAFHRSLKRFAIFIMTALTLMFSELLYVRHYIWTLHHGSSSCKHQQRKAIQLPLDCDVSFLCVPCWDLTGSDWPVLFQCIFLA